LASGRLRYMSEDALLLDPERRRAMPLPSAIVLKRGSWEALGRLFPKLGELPVWRRGGQDVRYWSPPTSQVATDPLPVRAIMFARYTADSEPSHLERLTPLEGLSRLVAAPCSMRTPITSVLTQQIADWARAVPFYALAYGSLSQAIHVVEDLVGS
jgi:hypothetical protein